MLPPHPFEGFSPASLRRAAWASAAVSSAVGAALLIQGQALRNPAAPHGLVDFELCATGACLSALSSAWGAAGWAEVRRLTLVDYAFLASYGPSLAALSLLFPGARRFPGAARAAAWAAFAAMGFDAAENTLGLVILGGGPRMPSAPLMAACAVCKFLLAAFPVAWLPLALFMRAPRE